MKSLLFYILSLESKRVGMKKNIILSDDVKEQGLSDIVEDEDNEFEKHVQKQNNFENKCINDYRYTPKVYKV